MSGPKETGKIKNEECEEIHKMTCIEWKIGNFFSIVEDNHEWCSPVISFAGTQWILRLYLEWYTLDDIVMFSIWRESSLDFSVEYTFGLKSKDGSVETTRPAFLRKEELFSSSWAIARLSEIQRQKSELALSDELTVTCTLKCKIVKGSALAKAKLIKLIALDTLSENFKSLYANKESCDVTLRVKDNEYKAHKSVLIARSPVFAATFLHEMTEEQCVFVVNILDCDAEFFEEFLEFLYCGKLEELSYQSAFHLYVTSDKFDVQDLKTFCIDVLTENLVPENLCDIAIFADEYDDMDLFSAAQDFFNENANKIFRTSEWEDLLKSRLHLASKLLKGMPEIAYVKKRKYF